MYHRMLKSRFEKTVVTLNTSVFDLVFLIRKLQSSQRMCILEESFFSISQPIQGRTVLIWRWKYRKWRSACFPLPKPSFRIVGRRRFPILILVFFSVPRVGIKNFEQRIKVLKCHHVPQKSVGGRVESAVLHFLPTWREARDILPANGGWNESFNWGGPVSGFCANKHLKASERGPAFT